MSEPRVKGEVVNLMELAALYGKHRNTVSAWVKRGLPYVQKADRANGVEWAFDTAEVAQWRESQAVHDAVGDTEGISEDELRRRKLAAETTIAEIDAAVKREEVVYITDVERLVSENEMAVNARLQIVPERVTSSLVGETDEQEIKKILLGEIHDCCRELQNKFIGVSEDSSEEDQSK